MAYSGTQVTRLGLYGGPRGRYGSFAGKAAAVVSALSGYRGNNVGLQIGL